MPTFEDTYLGDAAQIGPHTRLECKICWHVYDPAEGDEVWQIPPGTPFARAAVALDLPQLLGHEGAVPGGDDAMTESLPGRLALPTRSRAFADPSPRLEAAFRAVAARCRASRSSIRRSRSRPSASHPGTGIGWACWSRRGS